MMDWPIGWRATQAEEGHSIAAELRKECGVSHPLRGRVLRVIGRRQDGGDVLLDVSADRPLLALAHPKWRGRPEADPAWPKVSFYSDFRSWRDDMESGGALAAATTSEAAMRAGRASEDRVEIPPDAFLRTTGQLWIVALGTVILPWPAVLLGWWTLRQLGRGQDGQNLLVALGAILLISSAIIVLLTSVRCPNCHDRTLRRAWSDPGGLSALTVLLRARVCLACGYDPAFPVARDKPPTEARR
jgi:hypothetical protein